MNIDDLTIVIPAKNEEQGLAVLIPQIRAEFDDIKIIVVNDGSEDNTAGIAENHGCQVINHPHSLGNGAAVKSGARVVQTQFVAFMDGDGQHRVADLLALIDLTSKGYDLVVGQRDWKGQASISRGFGNWVYCFLASQLTNYPIKDLTSGFRLFRRDCLLRFLYLLPNGFSYPTTTTMAFLRVGYRVGFVPIKAEKRAGQSHINIFKDGIKFFLIVFKVATLYSPLRIFMPVALVFFTLGMGYSIYTLAALGRFTNMSALLLSFSVLVFLIGLISEQISTLIYKDSQEK